MRIPRQKMFISAIGKPETIEVVKSVGGTIKPMTPQKPNPKPNNPEPQPQQQPQTQTQQTPTNTNSQPQQQSATPTQEEKGWYDGLSGWGKAGVLGGATAGISGLTYLGYNALSNNNKEKE